MKLLDENGKTIGCKVLDQDGIHMLSRERLRILELLCRHPYYPAELARELDLPVQTVYYQIRKLERAGFLEFVQYEERKGGVAKKYLGKSQSFAVVIDSSGWKESIFQTPAPPPLLNPFVGRGFFDGLMVVGSPEPHGKYRARASEFGMLELAMLIGRYSAPVFPFYALDTQIRSEDLRKNLILAGGPKVNTAVADINSKLPIKFGQDYSVILSDPSKKQYTGNVGIVELIQNPYAKDKHILVVGGLNQNGTRAAVLAMLKNENEISNGNLFDPSVLAKVIEGFDEDGDGAVDTIEILE